MEQVTEGSEEEGGCYHVDCAGDVFVDDVRLKSGICFCQKVDDITYQTCKTTLKD